MSHLNDGARPDEREGAGAAVLAVFIFIAFLVVEGYIFWNYQGGVTAQHPTYDRNPPITMGQLR